MNEHLKTTVHVKIECLHTMETVENVGASVVAALEELIRRAPDATAGTFESKLGLDVTYSTVFERVDQNGRSLLEKQPISKAVNDAVAA